MNYGPLFEHKNRGNELAEEGMKLAADKAGQKFIVQATSCVMELIRAGKKEIVADDVWERLSMHGITQEHCGSVNAIGSVFRTLSIRKVIRKADKAPRPSKKELSHARLQTVWEPVADNKL